MGKSLVSFFLTHSVQSLGYHVALCDPAYSRAFQFAIWIDSFVKNRPSIHYAVFLAYLLYSLSQKIHHNARNWKLYSVEHPQKNSYAMYTIKITPNLLSEYQCTSGKFIRLPNRIEKSIR